MVLTGYCRQTFKDFEIFIADDGSGEEVRNGVNRFKKFIPITHFWQPHQGFRKSQILNETIRKAPIDYIIFTDGDCIPHRNFVLAHVLRRETKCVLCGRRVELGAKRSDSLTEDGVRRGELDKVDLGLFLKFLWERRRFIEEGVESSILSRLRTRRIRLLGSNFSLYKKHLLEINGFNEDYVGYGYEDVDLKYRLQLLGLQFKSVRNAAIQYHLHHKKRKIEVANLRILEITKKERKIVCTNGLRKLEG